MGRRDPEPQREKGTLCMDASFLGRKREGKASWATCMLE